jgi:hypothetical protein
MTEWPAHLQIREYPIQLAERALRVDPCNELARAAVRHGDDTSEDAER